uniref:Putative secreted protein n=1 Tax=Anopheles darlingi TaxID=43151 RepID=A0A2M4DQQ6_ANODA
MVMLAIGTVVLRQLYGILTAQSDCITSSAPKNLKICKATIHQNSLKHRYHIDLTQEKLCMLPLIFERSKR